MLNAVRRLYTTRQSLPRTIKAILNEKNPVEAPVSINGWIRSVRSQKNVSFANVNDGSNLKGIQAILNNDQAKNLTTGASVKLVGRLVPSPGHEQQHEMQVDQVEVLGESDSTYPLQKKRHTMEYLREIGHLRSRGNTGSAVLRLRNSAVLGFQRFFEQADCANVHTPIITSHDCEGGGEVFKVLPASTYTAQQSSHAMAPSEFFRKPVYLTVSGQLHAEILASSMGRVYTLGPVFRAEESQTSRHLAEFWMMEAEIAFIDRLDQLLDFTEECLVYATKYVLENSKEDLEFFNRWTDKTLLARLEKTVTKPFVRMTYSEAIDVLQQAQDTGKVKFEFPITWGSSLQSEHERYLATQHCQHPVFITNYPSHLKPFYMRADNVQDLSKQTVGCFDLLIPSIGELIGGSMREERYDILYQKMIDSKMDVEEYKWYLDLRRYGSVPHGGYGLGLERYMLWITGLESVRDVVPMPRHVGSCRY
ncbi:asparaginyl-tRNA synthetase [Umbelopsis sp. PMI_123]|nr:asparaginyl-tRNA synthetase [Umbelopsis sp. PMI_123]